MTQKSSQDVSSIHEEQLWILVYHLTVCRPLGSVAWTCRLWERVCPYMWLAVGTTWFSCFWRFWRCCGVFQGSVWLTKVVPSILRVQWVHTGALSVDVDASGSFRGSLNRGLWERVCPYMWANYNVKPSTSKIENFIKLYRSQIWPKKVVRMLVLSMKNNFEYLFTISRFADPLGRWPEHADYSMLHFQKWRKSMGNRSNSKICRSLEAIQVQWEEYWACWDLVLTI